MIITERERYLDIHEQIRYNTDKPIKDMKYLELVEVLNKEMKHLEFLSGQKNAQLQLFEDDKTETGIKLDP